MQYGEWLRAQSGVKESGVKEGQPPATSFGYQTSATTGQDTVLEVAEMISQGADKVDGVVGGLPHKKDDGKLPGLSDDGVAGTQSSNYIQIQNTNAVTISSEGRKAQGAKQGVEKREMGLVHFYDTLDYSDSTIKQMSQGKKQTKEDSEVTSSIKNQIGPIGEPTISANKGQDQHGKGNWKKLARGQPKEGEFEMEIIANSVGSKRRLGVEEETPNERSLKRWCGDETTFPFTMVEAARQPRREP